MFVLLTSPFAPPSWHAGLAPSDIRHSITKECKEIGNSLNWYPVLEHNIKVRRAIMQKVIGLLEAYEKK